MSTTEQATTVQPATDDELIVNECKLVALYLQRGERANADLARWRLEQWVLQKYGRHS